MSDAFRLLLSSTHKTSKTSLITKEPTECRPPCQMARQKKAPEFQCHVKYKNDLPLPPVSSVLLDSTLTLPQASLSTVLRNESVAYSPTSLETGTKHFSLPTELMKFSVYNMVDIENIGGRGGDKIGIANIQDDKEILLSIEELERKFNVVPSSNVGVGSTGNTVTNTINNTIANTNTIAIKSYAPINSLSKFSRPDVTWLRRTEYISSVKNNPNNTTNTNFEDDAKVLLSETIKFEEIVKAVEGTFDQTNEEHPIKSVELVQSYPILLDENSNFIHGLLFGEKNSVVSEGSLLKLDPPIFTLFTAKDKENSTTLKSVGEFDFQKTESTGKSFVLMLPADSQKDSKGVLAKITSTLSLRKRRSVKNSSAKNIKIIKITRK